MTFENAGKDVIHLAAGISHIQLTPVWAFSGVVVGAKLQETTFRLPLLPVYAVPPPPPPPPPPPSPLVLPQHYQQEQHEELINELCSLVE